MINTGVWGGVRGGEGGVRALSCGWIKIPRPRLVIKIRVINDGHFFSPPGKGREYYGEGENESIRDNKVL